MSSGGASLWANSELAKAYADVRGDLSLAARTAWAEAFRSAVPPAPLRRLLDIGCGTGRFTAFLSEVFGAAAVGVDGSVAMLQERAQVSGAPLAFLGADAAALPFRAGAIDLALLSMVYHLLVPPTAAVAELRRVIRPGGWVLLRTPTRELLDRVEFLAFFPESRAIDEARMPPRARITETFTGAGFTATTWRIVEQEFAGSPLEALERVRRRAFSTLRLISDEAFRDGLARYEAHCLDAPPAPRTESLEFFAFQRA
jgi:ubiquinone/menaquinone biosynthesis C-methylase UbiE